MKLKTLTSVILTLLLCGSVLLTASVDFVGAQSKVATPVISPGTGTYSGWQYFNISCNTPGATIRYTVGGAEPTSSSYPFSPFDINYVLSSTTIKAKAFKNGITDSDTAAATYTINFGNFIFLSGNSVNFYIPNESAGVKFAETLTNCQATKVSDIGYVLLSQIVDATPYSGQAINITAVGYNGEQSKPYWLGLSGNPILLTYDRFSSTNSILSSTNWTESGVNTIPAFGLYFHELWHDFNPGPSNTVLSAYNEELAHFFGNFIETLVIKNAQLYGVNQATVDLLVLNNNLYIASFYGLDNLDPNTMNSISSNVRLPAFLFRIADKYEDGGLSVFKSFIELAKKMPSASNSIEWNSQFIASIDAATGLDYRSEFDYYGFPIDNSSYKTYINSINLSNKVASPTFTPIGGSYSSSQSVTISCATAGATIRYTTNGSDLTSTTGKVYSGAISIASNTTLKTRAFLNGWTDSDVAAQNYTIIVPKVATPTFNPEGGTYSSTQSVTLGCTTSGSSIRFTTDGVTNPTSTTGTLYTGAISVSSSMTIKALAFKSGMTESNVASATYTISIPKVATPTFNPIGNTYSSTQTVTINCATTSATIRYTTDGSNPTSTIGNVYYGAISVGNSMTIKAKAFLSGMIDSDVVTTTYTINEPSKVVTPIFNPVGGTYSSTQLVTISCATSGSSIRYTADGVDPTSTTGTLYSSAISIASNMTLKAKAFVISMIDSDVVTATFTITTPTSNPTDSPTSNPTTKPTQSTSAVPTVNPSSILTPTPSPTSSPTPTIEPPTSSPKAQEATYNLWIILPVVIVLVVAVAILFVLRTNKREKTKAL